MELMGLFMADKDLWLIFKKKPSIMEWEKTENSFRNGKYSVKIQDTAYPVNWYLRAGISKRGAITAGCEDPDLSRQ